MHMADALISPAVGGTMWAVTAGAVAYAAKKVRQEIDEQKVPLMGVLGAFVFAAQMINFSIPGTGSSGHLGGGMLLAILLGPYAGFLTMASVLIIQALFFADGGLLALGCNIFNLGFWTCFVAYPLIYLRVVKRGYTGGRVLAGSLLSAIVGLQLGAFSVVLETVSSGITDLPFGTFVLLMQPIHLAIGAVEGLITAAIIAFVLKTRPEMIKATVGSQKLDNSSAKNVLVGLLAAALVAGGALSWFASSYPDGLEWSISKATGREEIEVPAGVHDLVAAIQEKTALFPDYNFKERSKAKNEDTTGEKGEIAPAYPAVDAGTSASGLVGSLMTLALASLIGVTIFLFKKYRKFEAA